MGGAKIEYGARVTLCFLYGGVIIIIIVTIQIVFYILQLHRFSAFRLRSKRCVWALIELPELSWKSKLRGFDLFLVTAMSSDEFGRQGRRGRGRKRGRGGMTVSRLEGGSNPKYSPLSSESPENIFDFIYLIDEKTVEYLKHHGRIVFVIRGPPGTRKEVLSDLICKTYPSSVVCSAHDFFLSPLAKDRSRESVRESHTFCAEKLKDYCKRNTPVIVLKNTHIRKTELEEYVDVIRDANYTMIVAETPRKFKLAQEVLEKTNRKGLNSDYLGKRMFQWDEFVPWFTGWFLNPADSGWLFQKSQDVLSLFENEETFKTFLDLSTKDTISSKFKQETVVFCIAAYCNVGQTDVGRAHYLNGEVQDYYGKMSELSIHSFIVKKNMLIAVVQLSPKQHFITLLGQDTTRLTPRREPRDPLTEQMKNLKIQDDYGILNNNVGLISTDNSTLTFEIKEIQTQDSLLAACGFILLGRECSQNSSPLFSDLTTTDSLYYYTSAEPNETVTIDGKVMHRVDDAWIIKLDSYYCCKSVFTGLY